MFFKFSTGFVKKTKSLNKKFTISNMNGIKHEPRNMDILLSNDENEYALRKKTFPNAKKTERDKTNNDSHWQGSRNRQITFWLDTGIASVHCNDYSKEHGGQDHLAVNLRTNKSNDFLVNEAYK